MSPYCVVVRVLTHCAAEICRVVLFLKQTFPLDQRSAAEDTRVLWPVTRGKKKKIPYCTVLWAQHSVILNSQQQPMRFSVRVCRVRCRENHRTAPQTASTILPYTPLLPLSAATVATSALHSPSHMRHLSLETHSGKLVHIQRRQTLCFNPFFFILIWKCDNSFTHNHLAASLLDGDSCVHLW